jgi:hypothetical protein
LSSGYCLGFDLLQRGGDLIFVRAERPQRPSQSAACFQLLAGPPRNLGPQPFGSGRSPRISRNSLGPFVSRRFRLSCSSTGSDPASPRRRSIACPAISRALAADFLVRFCDRCAPPASACPTSRRIASALVGRGAGCVLIQTSRDFNSSGGMRTLSCFAFASLRLNGIASSFRGSTAEQAVMPGWDCWFVVIVDQHGHKVDEVPIADYAQPKPLTGGARRLNRAACGRS